MWLCYEIILSALAKVSEVENFLDIFSVRHSAYLPLVFLNSECLYINQEIEPGVEHYLRRGRALAAFNTLLGPRALFLEPETEGTGKSLQPPEYSKLLDSLSEKDESLIASVCVIRTSCYYLLLLLVVLKANLVQYHQQILM